MYVPAQEQKEPHKHTEPHLALGMEHLVLVQVQGSPSLEDWHTEHRDRGTEEGRGTDNVLEEAVGRPKVVADIGTAAAEVGIGKGYVLGRDTDTKNTRCSWVVAGCFDSSAVRKRFEGETPRERWVRTWTQ